MQKIILKVRCFERGLSKSLKHVNFIFSFELSTFYFMTSYIFPLPFSKVWKEREKIQVSIVVKELLFGEI